VGNNYKLNQQTYISEVLRLLSGLVFLFVVVFGTPASEKAYLFVDLLLGLHHFLVVGFDWILSQTLEEFTHIGHSSHSFITITVLSRRRATF